MCVGIGEEEGVVKGERRKVCVGLNFIPKPPNHT